MDDDFPPYESIKQCLRTCPGTFFTYVLMWRNTKENELFIHKKGVKDFYVTDLNLFCEYLSLLKGAGLLDFHEDPESFYVIMRVSMSAEGKIPC
jgi:hypothetical protein